MSEKQLFLMLVQTASIARDIESGRRISHRVLGMAAGENLKALQQDLGIDTEDFDFDSDASLLVELAEKLVNREYGE